MDALLAITVAVLAGAGVYAILTRDLFRLAIGLALVAYAVNLLILASGHSRGRAPIHPIPKDALTSDPLVQALVLTAIVISAGTTAIVIGLVHRTFAAHRTLDQAALHAADGPAERGS